MNGNLLKFECDLTPDRVIMFVSFDYDIDKALEEAAETFSVGLKRDVAAYQVSLLTEDEVCVLNMAMPEYHGFIG